MKKGKGNVLAVILATVGIMLFGTLAVSADAHAGIQSASGKSRIVQDNTYERMAITRAGEISVYYNAMRPSGTPGLDCIIGFYDKD